MYNLVKKNNMKILVSLISLMVLFLGLTFLVRKDNMVLSEHQKILKQYDQYQTGDEAIEGTDYVTFDAFFLEDVDNDGNADRIRGNSIEIGYFLDEDYWGLGIMTKSLKKCIEYAFKKLEVDRVIISSLVENERCMKLIKKFKQ